ncbi:MAG: CHAT domain-containing protein, partial [Deltaproteobacteria bacterium]|nr:CHAT domain-containing protein [Deltaproteobacteria bacterium]
MHRYDHEIQKDPSDPAAVRSDPAARKGVFSMKHLPAPFNALLCVGIFLLSFPQCTQKVTVADRLGEANYRYYEGIPFESINLWIQTDIRVPPGGVVVVLARGEVLPRGGGKGARQAYQALRFKVGQDGTQYSLAGGSDPARPANLQMVRSERGGPLLFYIRGKSDKHRSTIRATVYLWDGDGQKNLLEDVGELIRNHPGDSQYMNLLGNLGGFYMRSGDYEKVDRVHQWAEENLGLKLSYHPGVLLRLSWKEYRLGRHARAKELVEKGLAQCRKKGRTDLEARTLSMMARLETALGDNEKAVRLAEETVRIGRQTKRRVTQAQGHSVLGAIYLNLGRMSEARKHFEEALDLLAIKGIHALQTECLLGLGEMYMRQEEYGKARKSLESAARNGRALGQSEALWIAHSRLGRICEIQGDPEQALGHYEEAIGYIEAMRGRMTDPNLKAFFMENKLHVYEWMIRLLRRMHRDPEALHYLERAKARALLDMLGEKAFSSGKARENDLLALERELRQGIQELSMEAAETSAEEDHDASERKVEQDALEARYRTVLDEIAALNPELASLISIRPLKANEIQALLDPETALVEYFLGKEIRLAFVVTPERVLSVPLEETPETIYEMIRKFREDAVEKVSLERLGSQDYRIPLSGLYEALIRPLEEHIAGKTHLVIVPHGMLHYLPFHALISRGEDGERYLLEKYGISYAPSGSVLKYARMKNRGAGGDLFAVGNPDTGLAPLPAAEREALEIGGLFQNKLVLIGEKGTETSVKRLSPGYGTVLLSTHGKMMEATPLQSNLRFTPSGKDDGRLTVDEIFDMDLRANLVTLSACETGLAKGAGGAFPQGDDLVGLSRAFIFAGVPSVVASLWEVSDDSTVEFMLLFFRHMQS